jgi:ElaB/YqjD/DUF883 family membrane-anchored ribosome-binding protein
MPAQDKPHGGQTGSAGHSLKDEAADQFGRLADKATHTFRDVSDQAQHFAERMAEQGREAGEKVQEVAGNLKAAAHKSLKDQPMVTLAMAVVLGFMLGALWRK